MEIQPVRTETEYNAALAEVESLMDAAPGTVAFDRLEVLAVLVEAYERRHHPILPPDPIAVIEYEMEKRNRTRADLERVLQTGSGRVSEILNRRRPLTLAMIRRLNDAWGIPAASLMAEYAVARKRRPARRKSSVEAAPAVNVP